MSWPEIGEKFTKETQKNFDWIGIKKVLFDF